MNNTPAQVEYDRCVYEHAWNYLTDHFVALYSTSPRDLEKYFTPERPADLAGIYRYLLTSAQGYWMAPNVISRPIGGIDALKPVLCNFQPSEILQAYPGGPQQVLEAIFSRLLPGQAVPTNPKSLWQRYGRSIITGARFLSNFTTARDFYAWADDLYSSEDTLYELPLRVCEAVRGLGPALALDFLKELGYTEYAKPDGWLVKIFNDLKLSQSRDALQAAKDIRRVAHNVGQTPYKVDKVFWLIATGDFYFDQPRRAGWPGLNNFIELARQGCD